MPFDGKARRRTSVRAVLLHTTLALTAAALAAAGEPVAAEPSARPACHTANGWDGC